MANLMQVETHFSKSASLKITAAFLPPSCVKQNNENRWKCHHFYTDQINYFQTIFRKKSFASITKKKKKVQEKQRYLEH